jgi:hypothetical protein
MDQRAPTYGKREGMDSARPLSASALYQGLQLSSIQRPGRVTRQLELVLARCHLRFGKHALLPGKKTCLAEGVWVD